MKQKIVLIGMNGYGEHYLEALLTREDVVFVGIVEIHPEKSAFLEKVKQLKIPIFTTLEAFYQQNQADLAIIATPIHLHTEQAICALQHESNVLCEKPIFADMQDRYQWEQAIAESGKWAAVGFNWSFTAPILELKEDIRRGIYGKPKQLKTLVLWPRDEDYFARSAWSGRLASANGKLIRDSVANNAAAHFIHNMLFVLGEELQRTVQVDRLEAELYRANNIETFDTCAIRLETEGGCEMLFLGSHATEKEQGPQFMYTFEKGHIVYDCNLDQGVITAYTEDGQEKVYGNPQANHLDKLDYCIGALTDGRDIPCTFETAIGHAAVIEAVHKAVPQSHTFPAEIQQLTGKRRTVAGLEEELHTCFVKGKLPNELQIPWSRPAQQADVVTTMQKGSP
ncbi:Gfo/Idh/MocA family protein [Terribacillus sp. DMT04]|uniref:Gfo/Idh/MocA family protein n=1 Tax=Terribacillus sp. DMT04 TaxID=2850441 RepID=UPI001C2B981F|nr:Gfo/Idh/MocA family oxidoreductase [Terribacillus sp. DMT04]QXE02014.1 Gfo/Idh/MocA family oxidoreductase [Terribacillus sp. DMT04]